MTEQPAWFQFSDTPTAATPSLSDRLRSFPAHLSLHHADETFTATRVKTSPTAPRGLSHSSTLLSQKKAGIFTCTFRKLCLFAAIGRGFYTEHGLTASVCKVFKIISVLEIINLHPDEPLACPEAICVSSSSGLPLINTLISLF